MRLIMMIWMMVIIMMPTVWAQDLNTVVSKSVMSRDWYFDANGRWKSSDALVNYDFSPIQLTDEQITIRTPEMGSQGSVSEFNYLVLDNSEWYKKKNFYSGKDLAFRVDTKQIDRFGYVTYKNSKFLLMTIPGKDVFVFRGVKKETDPKPNEIGMANIVWTDRRFDNWSRVDRSMVWSKFQRRIFTETEPNLYEVPLFNSVKSVKADSEYTEKINGEDIVYRARNMAVNFSQDEVAEKNFIQIPPWVEGVAGPGIGQKVYVEFWEPFDNIIVLNGYVDLLNPKLYKENNRVKDMLVIGKDDGGNILFEESVFFVDVPSFQKFEFPVKARFVELMIQSVYSGTKYDDTCIRSIFSWPSR